MARDPSVPAPPDGPACETIVEVLRWRAAVTPDAWAFSFLLDGEADEVQLTYGELDRQARAIGATLQARGLVGERILLLYPPGLDFIAGFFGCLYAGAVAVPTYPPDPSRLERTLPRLQAIVADSAAVAALTTEAFGAMRGLIATQAPELARLTWLASDASPVAGASGWTDPGITGARTAFLQYTSGSTAVPKGVVVRHANVMHNVGCLQHGTQAARGALGVGWLPPYHDMGLVGNILYPVSTGMPFVHLSPLHFLARPYRWLAAMSRFRAQGSAAPSFAYDLCVRKIGPAERATLDLSAWEVALDAAEPVRADTIDRFVEAFGPCGFRRETFYPCYGLAEATLIVSGGRRDAAPVARTVAGRMLETGRAVAADASAPDARRLVGCGAALPDTTVAIVDPQSGRRCADDRIGEIWVAGPSVTAGYWNRPAETAAAYGARPTGETGDATFLRTGDLGFVHDGELFVTGRTSDLIIVRGRNIAPDDVERTVEASHPALRPGCGAAFGIEENGAERLVVVHEIDPTKAPDTSAVLDAIERAVVREVGIAPHAVALLSTRTIPKTSSGKIQRHACRDGWQAGTLTVLADRGCPPAAGVTVARHAAATAEPPPVDAAAVEAWLRQAIAGVLQLDVRQVSVHKPVATYGIDSSEVAGLVVDLERWLGRTLPLDLVWEWASAREIAARIVDHVESGESCERPVFETSDGLLRP